MNTCSAYYQFVNTTFTYAAHGTSSGLATMASGGSFWQGFATGAVSSFVSSATEGLCHLCKVPEGWTKAAMVAAGGLSFDGTDRVEPADLQSVGMKAFYLHLIKQSVF